MGALDEAMLGDLEKLVKFRERVGECAINGGLTVFKS